MTAIFPRLSSTLSLQRMAGWTGMSIEQIATHADQTLGTLPVTYSTGAARLPVERLLALRTQLRGFATRSGYPRKAGVNGQQQFDRETALFLRAFPGLEAGEAIRAETWQYISAALLPDVVVWRWASGTESTSVSEERYLGGIRNCFGRLWHRATVFWDDRLVEPGVMVGALLEDNFVAILERSAFAVHPAQCRAVARGFLLRKPLARRADGKGLDEALLRDTMRRMVRMTGFRALWSLDPEDLRECTATALDEALRALGVALVAEHELVVRQPALGWRPEGEPSEQGSALARAAGPGSADSAARPASPVAPPPPESPSFAEMRPSQRAAAVWETMLGMGAQTTDQMVFLAARGLRDRGLVEFERFRPGGPLSVMIAEAIEVGVRARKFERPARGKRRAIAFSLQEIPPGTLEFVVRTALGADVCKLNLVVEVAAEWLEHSVGLPRSPEVSARFTALIGSMQLGGEILEGPKGLRLALPQERLDAAAAQPGGRLLLASKVAERHGIETVDKTASGGALWFIIDSDAVWRAELEAMGLLPCLAAGGSRATGGRTAWYVKPE